MKSHNTYTCVLYYFKAKINWRFYYTCTTVSILELSGWQYADVRTNKISTHVILYFIILATAKVAFISTVHSEV